MSEAREAPSQRARKLKLKPWCAVDREGVTMMDDARFAWTEIRVIKQISIRPLNQAFSYTTLIDKCGEVGRVT